MNTPLVLKTMMQIKQNLPEWSSVHCCLQEASYSKLSQYFPKAIKEQKILYVYMCLLLTE